jgi:nucleoside-diphosphate-sugar epimerase
LIGSHLAEVLLSTGHQVALLDRRFNWHTDHLHIPKIRGDVLDFKQVREVVRAADVVVHLAAVSRVEDGERDPNRCMRVNLDGTLNVAKSVLELDKTMLFASSREVYGNARSFPVVENSPKQPLSVYAISKLRAENSLKSLHVEKRLKVVILRFSNVYGSLRDRPQRVIPRFVKQALSGRDITVHDGRQTVDFTFVDDVAATAAQVIGRSTRAVGHDYNIVTGRSISVADLARMVKLYTGSESRIIFQKERDYYASKFVGSSGKITKFLDDEFHMRPLEEGLKVYIDKVRSQRPPLARLVQR